MSALVSNPLVWIFLILGTMVIFIVTYERPVSFQVDPNYHLFNLRVTHVLS